MITIGMNYKVLAGKENNFERMFNNVLDSLKTVAGHGQSALYKDVNALQSYLIVSEWDSEEAFHTFIQSEKFRGVVEWGQENILADRPVHTVYRSGDAIHEHACLVSCSTRPFLPAGCAGLQVSDPTACDKPC
jgi:heme-degrading monooxygenase HmoA